MYDTTFSNQTQRMVFSSKDAPNPELVGEPKGIRRVLLERGLWIEGFKRRCVKKKGEPSTCKKGESCCAFRILEAQPDFTNEISLLETTIRNLGHECIFIRSFIANSILLSSFGQQLNGTLGVIAIIHSYS